MGADSQLECESARKVCAGYFDNGVPRCSFRITGMDQPRPVTAKDGECCVEDGAHHMLEVVRGLDSSVAPIPVFEQLKEFKRIALRSDKTDTSFRAMIYLSAAIVNSR